MKGPETFGRVLVSRKKSRSSGFRFFDTLRNGWRRLVERVQCARPAWMLRVFLILLFVGVVLDFVSFSFQTLPIVPEAIQITGLKQISADHVRTEIFRKLRTQNAENLLEVDLTDLSDYIREHIPAIRSAGITMNVERGVMTVAAVERSGIAVIRLSGMGGTLEVDREGMLYSAGAVAPSSLPEVSGIAGSLLVPGRNLHEHPAGAGLMRLLSSLPPHFPRPLKSARVVRPEYVELTFAGGILVKTDPATFPYKVENLGNILAKTADRQVSYIDIQFQRDVISYQEEPKTRTRGSTPKKMAGAEGKRKGR